MKSAKYICPTTTNYSKIATYYEMDNDIHLITCLTIDSPAHVTHDRDYHMISDPLMTTGELKRIISISHGSDWSNVFMIDEVFNKAQIEKEKEDKAREERES